MGQTNKDKWDNLGLGDLLLLFTRYAYYGPDWKLDKLVVYLNERYPGPLGAQIWKLYEEENDANT